MEVLSLILIVGLFIFVAVLGKPDTSNPNKASSKSASRQAAWDDLHEQARQTSAQAGASTPVKWDSSQTQYSSGGLSENLKANENQDIWDAPHSSSSVSPQATVLTQTDSNLSINKCSSSTAFSDEHMKTRNSIGYGFYCLAKMGQNAELFNMAGDAYDLTYSSSAWGDSMFGAPDWRSFISNMSLDPDLIGEKNAEPLIEGCRERLVIGCECFAMALGVNPEYYWANLRLASALTVALQPNAALPYWRKAIELNTSDTSRALVADCGMTIVHNRCLAAREVAYRLGLGYSAQQFPLVYFQQQSIASIMLKSSPYLVEKVRGLA